MPSVLIVEDDAASRDALAEVVRLEGFTDVETASSMAGARKVLERGPFDLVLTDLLFPDGSGMDLIPEILESPQTDVIVITGHATVDTAVDAMRQGAVDYLTKPIDRDRLQGLLSKAATTASLRQEVRELRDELRSLGRFGPLIGSSPPMQEVYDLIGKVAPRSASVLITGPTGSGKELVAQMVHRLSRRARKPFVPINCAAVAPSLIESELFGHEKGSFTGAERPHRGVFERADGGTLFLDEITEMPLELQVKLLRVLETSKFSRVGDESLREVDVRLIAATNHDPQEAVHSGKLREDLLYRLNVFPVALPPLQQRKDDIVLLAQHFLDRLNADSDTAKRFTESALDVLRTHDWPGNVRELRNAVERAHILAPDDRVDAEHIPLADARPDAAASEDRGAVRAGVTIAEIERQLILKTLDEVDGNRERAAAMLGISTKTLYNRLKQYKG